MRICPLIAKWLWLLLLIVLASSFGCADCDDGSNEEEGDDDSAEGDDDDDDEPVDFRPLCPEDEIESAKGFLAEGKGDAARASFFSILDEYPRCNEAHFGVALADQLRLYNVT